MAQRWSAFVGADKEQSTMAVVEGKSKKTLTVKRLSSALESQRATKWIETRRATKWHAELTKLTYSWTCRPPLTTNGPIEPSTFPYTETQSLTKHYLGKLKSQEDTDSRLLELIRGHDCKEAAFAACAAHLSSDVVKDFLETEFEADSNKTANIQAYLAAFDAAAYYKSFDFAPRDRTFARILDAVAGDPTAAYVPTLHVLVSAWQAGSPTDRGLHSRAISLTATVFHNVNLTLERYRTGFAWEGAAKYRTALTLLLRATETAGARFKGCVNAFFPTWRRWVRWMPETISSLSVLTSSGHGAKLKCLRELEGPDMADGDDCQVVEWLGLIRRQQLIPWLEEKGFKIGVGLIVGDTESLLVEFMERLREVVRMAMGDGVSSIRLLTMYVEREGLDMGTLAAWEDARKLLLKPLPKFVEYIVDPNKAVSDHEALDVLVGKALDVLNAPNLEPVRWPIKAEIAHCVRLAYDNVKGDLRVCMPLLELSHEWLTPALRLWHLRQRLAGSKWLHPVVDRTLVQESLGQPPTRNLEVLKELHVRVKTVSHASLLKALDVYVRCYVYNGDFASAQLALGLHSLWTNVHDHATREAAITLAMLDDVPASIRYSCITALKTATGTAAEQLEDRLLQIQARVRAAYIDLTETIMSLTGLVSVQACWAGLLWTMLKRDAVAIDEQVFTDRGYEAYVRWTGHLNSLFGDELALVTGTRSWLAKLKGLETVLESFKTLEGSGKVINKVLTATSSETQQRFVKVLGKIKSETRLQRRTYMFELFLCLDSTNATAICQAIFTCSTLSDSEFLRCEHFLTLASRNKDLATARLAIWLNMSEFSPKMKAAFIEIGQVTGLKETSDAWLAAKKHFDKKVWDLVARARTLDSTRMALMRHNRPEVESTMAELKLEVPAGIAAILEDLPAELADVVEDVAEDQLELHFSLSNLHSLIKLALGVQGTETVVVTLRMYEEDAVDAFCVHVEETVGATMLSHEWIDPNEGKSAPSKLPCGGNQSRLSFVVARAVWRQLQREEFDITRLHAYVKDVIQHGANKCIMCAKDVGARLHRATGCGSSLCDLTAGEVDFRVRMEMVRHDKRVMDLLLTTVYAVASSQNMQLLPGLPSSWHDASKLLTVLNALPATETLAKASISRSSLRLVGTSHEQAAGLASWLCNASRTFIISATGDWRIPNMPGIHQFLIVDNPPEVEAAFAKHNHLQPRMVLFHGTSMDRLYAIMAQGLRVLSNTNLMKNGAASGAGIYFSAETSTPSSYAGQVTPMSGQATFFHSRRDFDGPQVMLGCEHAGPVNTNGIFVVQDPSKVIVRYIFLFPPGTPFPMAKDIVAPMVSTFYSLRASAAVSK